MLQVFEKEKENACIITSVQVLQNNGAKHSTRSYFHVQHFLPKQDVHCPYSRSTYTKTCTIKKIVKKLVLFSLHYFAYINQLSNYTQHED
jgi:hypothetical protein